MAYQEGLGWVICDSATTLGRAGFQFRGGGGGHRALVVGSVRGGGGGR